MKVKESLAQYVGRVRREKSLSLKDVSRKSGGSISDAYISKIENSKEGNPSRVKLLALAKGLGVHAGELFQVAQGAAVEDSDDFLKSTFAHAWQLYTEIEDPELKGHVEFLIENLIRAIETFPAKSSRAVGVRR